MSCTFLQLRRCHFTQPCATHTGDGQRFLPRCRGGIEPGLLRSVVGNDPHQHHPCPLSGDSVAGSVHRVSSTTPPIPSDSRLEWLRRSWVLQLFSTDERGLRRVNAELDSAGRNVCDAHRCVANVDCFVELPSEDQHPQKEPVRPTEGSSRPQAHPGIPEVLADRPDQEHRSSRRSTRASTVSSVRSSRRL